MVPTNTIFESIFYLLVALYNTFIEMIFYSKLKAPKSDISGQVFVITGGNAGIGKDIARQILDMNPKKVYITSRSAERGQKALNELKAATGKDNIEVLSLNLDSLASVKKAAEELKKKEEKIDNLILNAGIGFYKKGLTEDGYDIMYQSNHLGHHLFLELLLPNLRAAAKPGHPARVQLTSSTAHFGATESSLSKMETTASGMTQYSNTKMMNLLMVRYYSKKLSPDVVVHGIHPGGVDSDFTQKFPEKMAKYGKMITSKAFRTVESGAATSVFVATHPDAGKITGRYWSNMQTLAPHRIATDDIVMNRYMTRSFEEIKIKS